ncbi:MAG: hypothetical protein IJ588_13770 [Prevotella sp.]|nr:hypothetical protein [Prevotella sp.]
MTAKDFFMLVVQMRQAQKNYFAARKRQAPYEECNNLKNISKGFERQIDAEIDRVKKLTSEPELNFG